MTLRNDPVICNLLQKYVWQPGRINNKAENVWVLIHNFHHNGYQEKHARFPVPFKPNQHDWNEFSCVFDYQYYQALTFDQPDTQWIVFSSAAFELEKILKVFNGQYNQWHKFKQDSCELAIVKSRPEVFPGLAKKIVEFAAPDRCVIDFAVLVNRYAICDYGWLTCLTCSRNPKQINHAIHCWDITFEKIVQHEHSKQHILNKQKEDKRQCGSNNNTSQKPLVNNLIDID